MGENTRCDRFGFMVVIYHIRSFTSGTPCISWNPTSETKKSCLDTTKTSFGKLKFCIIWYCNPDGIWTWYCAMKTRHPATYLPSDLILYMKILCDTKIMWLCIIHIICKVAYWCVPAFCEDLLHSEPLLILS